MRKRERESEKSNHHANVNFSLENKRVREKLRNLRATSLNATGNRQQRFKNICCLIKSMPDKQNIFSFICIHVRTLHNRTTRCRMKYYTNIFIGIHVRVALYADNCKKKKLHTNVIKANWSVKSSRTIVCVNKELFCFSCLLFSEMWRKKNYYLNREKKKKKVVSSSFISFFIEWVAFFVLLMCIFYNVVSVSFRFRFNVQSPTPAPTPIIVLLPFSLCKKKNFLRITRKFHCTVKMVTLSLGIGHFVWCDFANHPFSGIIVFGL